MSNTINPKATPAPAATPHLNYMGGKSYNISDAIKNLRLAASSSFFGEPMYYTESRGKSKKKSSSYSLTDIDVQYLNNQLNAVDPQEWRGKSPAELMVMAIDKALDYSIEATLEEAVRLRNEDHIRVTPQVILVRAANHKLQKGTGLVRQYGPKIIGRTDELATGLAYQLFAFGKPIPNSLKKLWKKILESQSEYQLAKYRMEDKAYKLTDVVSLVHAKSEAITKLMQDQLKNTDNTWEAIISAEGSEQATWEKALDVMGHMALLRNIRNLVSNKVDSAKFLDKLKAGAATGKQLPFRYYSAYLANKEASPKILDAIEECLEISLANLPKFEGRVMSLCDNSGSAWSTATSSMGTVVIAKIANLTGVITGKVADEGYVGVFGDRLEIVPIRKKTSVFSDLDNICKIGGGIGGSTENGIWLFWDQAIKNKEHWDHVFVYSDMQAGHGGLYGLNSDTYSKYNWKGRYIDVAKLINHYRKEVNPNVMVYLVQVAGYQDTIIPEFYDKTYILGGWGEGLLKFAHSMSSSYKQ